MIGQSTAKVLLINPPYLGNIYASSKFRAIMNQGMMPLGLCCLASYLPYKVKILDLNVCEDGWKQIWDFKPDWVGFTATTPLIDKASKIASIIKDQIPVKVVVGGAHATACSREIIEGGIFDVAVVGEGEVALKEILDSGVDDSCVFYATKRLENLDDFPFPAYHLLDIHRYQLPPILSRRNPVASIQTSRGCYGQCSFCTKGIETHKLRFKSPQRVLDEIEYVLSLGFGEIHIIDDNFTADIARAAEICERIIAQKLKFTWYPRNGVRVDRVDFDLLKLMKRAGCYRIPFGVESGSQRVLDAIGKGISLEQARYAVSMAKQVGMITETYFMIGLPGETEKDLKSTIDFAIRLDADYSKLATTIPFPGTKLYKDMDKKGQILTKDWSKYHFAISPRKIYRHDTLSWDVLEKYARRFYFRYYFRPVKVFKMLWNSLFRDHNFKANFSVLLKTRWT